MPTNFSFLKSLWKGLQSVLEAAAAVAIVAGFDYMLTRADEAAELTDLGLPVLYIPAALFAIRILTNWWKVRRAALLTRAEE